MTLKVRNKVMKLFFFFSLFCIACALISFIIALINKAVTPPPVLRIPSFMTKVPFLKYSFTATMIGICLIVLYSPIAVAHILPLFEATQTTEIIFFMAFLCGCLCESVRFLTPLFGLWSTFSDMLFFYGRILFVGRLLCPLSFVFAAICSSAEQRQDVERNMTILFCICVVFAIIVPINTARISSSGTVTWGFPTLFFFSRIVFSILAFSSFLINSIKQNVKEYKILGYSMLGIMAGYGILVCADNYLFIIIGYPVLLAGTSFYLRNLHSLYMWK